MSLLELLQNPVLLISLTTLIGLMVGSFLNVVIYRLPVMMKSAWRRECHDYLQLDYLEDQSLNINLLLPGSHCPTCKASVKAYHNIPLVSYILLGGKCAHCKTTISLRYPFVELLTGICSALVAWRFGYSNACLFALILTWSLLVLSFIDYDEQLLPDSINLPVMWLGLFLSLFDVFTDSHASIIGCIAGYLSLWSVYQLFKLVTGKEGMGFGDFKLLALLGAWLGWVYLPLIVVLSSFMGALFGVGLILMTQRDALKPMPFGPFLAIAGWIALLWGDAINNLYLNLLGI